MADLAYDAGNPETIDRSEEKTITVTGGCSPFTWAVTGTGFTLANATTIGRTNTLVADATACGTAAISVTDTWSDIAAYVRALLAEPNAVFFGDDEIGNWKEQACMDISSKALCYETSEPIALLDDTLEYTKPGGCLRVYACLFENKGLYRIHPRQIGHASEMKSGPPEFYYDFAGKVGFYPVCDEANAEKNVTVLFSKLTDDICDIPIEYRLYAVLYVFYRALIKARKYASARIIVKIYLRNLLFHRQDLYERGVDTREMMKVLDKTMSKER